VEELVEKSGPWLLGNQPGSQRPWGMVYINSAPGGSRAGLKTGFEALRCTSFPRGTAYFNLATGLPLVNTISNLVVNHWSTTC